jgi:hypothetical protein
MEFSLIYQTIDKVQNAVILREIAVLEGILCLNYSGIAVVYSWHINRPLCRYDVISTGST